MDGVSDLPSLIARIWEDLLGVPVGVDDDFFTQLGGHSLTAAAAADEVGQATRLPVEAYQLYTSPTPRELAAVLQAVRERMADLHEAARREPDGPLTALAEAFCEHGVLAAATFLDPGVQLLFIDTDAGTSRSGEGMEYAQDVLWELRVGRGPTVTGQEPGIVTLRLTDGVVVTMAGKCGVGLVNDLEITYGPADAC